MNDKSFVQRKTILQRATVCVALIAALAVLACIFFVGTDGQKSIFYYFGESLFDKKAANWEEYWGFFNGEGQNPSELINACKSLDTTYMVATCAISVATLFGVACFSVFSIVAFVQGVKKEEYHNTILFSLIAVIIYCTGVAGLFAMENMAMAIPSTATDKVTLNTVTVVGLIVSGVAFAAMLCGKTLETLWSAPTRARVVKTYSGVIGVLVTLAVFLLSAFMTLKAEIAGAFYEGTPFTFAYLTVAGFGNRGSGKSGNMEITAQFAQIFFGFMLIFLMLGMLRQIRNLVNDGKYKSGLGWAVLSTLMSLLVLLLSLSLSGAAKKIVGNGCEVNLVLPLLVFVLNAVNWAVTLVCKKRCEKERVQYIDI